MQNNQSLDCLHFAAQGNQPRILNYLLKLEHLQRDQSLRGNVNHFRYEKKDVNGFTALHWACHSGSYQAVRYLLANGSDPNAQTYNERSTPLLVAMRVIGETREPKILHKLLLYGADASYSDVNGESCETLIEALDPELQHQCKDLLENIGKGSRKHQGLFCKGRKLRCLKQNRTKKN